MSSHISIRPLKSKGSYAILLRELKDEDSDSDKSKHFEAKLGKIETSFNTTRMQILNHGSSVTHLWAEVVGITHGFNDISITQGSWTILFDRFFKINFVTYFITPKP